MGLDSQNCRLIFFLMRLIFFFSVFMDSSRIDIPGLYRLMIAQVSFS